MWEKLLKLANRDNLHWLITTLRRLVFTFGKGTLEYEEADMRWGEVDYIGYWRGQRTHLIAAFVRPDGTLNFDWGWQIQPGPQEEEPHEPA